MGKTDKCAYMFLKGENRGLRERIGRLEIRLFEQESTNRKLEAELDKMKQRERICEEVYQAFRANPPHDPKDDRIEELEAELDAMTSRYSRAATDIASLEGEVEASKERIQQLYASHERKDAELAELRRDNVRLQGEIETVRAVKGTLEDELAEVRRTINDAAFERAEAISTDDLVKRLTAELAEMKERAEGELPSYTEQRCAVENAKLKDQAKYAYTIAGGSVLFAVLLAILAR